MKKNKMTPAKPFLKWAGGKSQLLVQFEKYYPGELKRGDIKTYIEPFMGSGAVFFYIMQKYRQLESVYLLDNNRELVLTYTVLKRRCKELIQQLEELSEKFSAGNEQERFEFYYEIRDKYNSKRPTASLKRLTEFHIERAAQMIFLNKTCFNGLFRLNQSEKFNVPFGRYKNPRILDRENIKRASRVLKGVEVCFGDFADCEKYVDDNTFVYFDPPYRPISQTSSFTSYSQIEFDDNEQIRLGRFFSDLDEKHGALLMLSNSDPANNGNPDDDFFSELYQRFNIHHVFASRMINSKAKKRGQISELLITNYNCSSE